MRIRSSLAIGAAALLVASSVSAQRKQTVAPAPLLGGFTSFTATMSGGIIKEQPKKIFRSGDLVRIDLPGKFHVTNLSTSETWAVHPDRCAHMPVPDIATYPLVALRNYEVKRSPTDETMVIDGHRCKLENDTFTPTKEGFPRVSAK